MACFLQIALLVAAVLHNMGSAAAADLPDMSYVEHREDFLGDEVPSAFHVSLAGTSFVRMSEHLTVNGWLEMGASEKEGAARLRLGEDRDDSPVHHLNFSTRHLARATTRLVINADVGLEATVGFTGKDDPANIGGALLYRSNTQTWYLQCTRNYSPEHPERSTVVDTKWKHTPGVPFVVTIRTSPTKVTAHIDGRLVATVTTNIPADDGMPWEFQLWNRKDPDGAWSAPVMWIDYLAIRQERLPPSK